MNLLARILVIVLVSFSLTQNSFAKRLSCGGDYKLTVAGKAKGAPHQDVERAGIMLVKDYGSDIPGKPKSRYVVILGHTIGSKNHYNFQAGQCDAGDKATTTTASREAQEETGGFVKISPNLLSKQPYVFHGQKQLFFVRDDNLSVRQITHACSKACKNHKLPHAFREVDHVVAVPLSELLKLAEHVRNRGGQAAPSYLIYSRSGNKPVRVDGYYIRMIAYRLQATRQILNHLFPGAKF